MSTSSHLENLIGRYPALERCRSDIQCAFGLLAAAFDNDRKLLLCGNGGSAADSEHWAGEMLKGFAQLRPLTSSMRRGMQPETASRLQWAFPVIPLTGFPALATAFGNDVDSEYVFAQLVFALGRTGDVLAALSTSGNSANVCRAAEVARARDISVLALTGESGGGLRKLADVCICVPATQTPHIQEFHLPIYHCLSLMLEEAFATRWQSVPVAAESDGRKSHGSQTGQIDFRMNFTPNQTNPNMNNTSLENPLFFERNRVFRVYEGGKLFHDFFGDEAVDGNLPEEWIASKVKALNKVMRSPDEGLSKIRGGGDTFASLLIKHTEEMTGGRGFDMLVKVLDSAIRLPAQTHPDPAFSRKYFSSNHGKTECWVILATRPGAKLFFGFKAGVTEADLRQAVEKSEVPGDAFSGLLQEVEAKAGDVWLIPARVAHAIGAGCLILEVQEPTDFTIQPERWCDHYRLSDQEMYLGLDKEIALSCFDLKQSGPSVLARGKKQPRIEVENAGVRKEVLISFNDTPCFAVNRYTVKPSSASCALKKLAVYVVTKGNGELISPAGKQSVRKGMYFFVPFAAGETTVRTETGLELIECLPPTAKNSSVATDHPLASVSERVGV